MELVITKMIMVETRGHNQQFNRPYQMGNIDDAVLNQFHHATRGGFDVTATSIAGIAGMLIAPSAEASAQVNITNGWDFPRFRYMMEVQINTGLSSGFSEVICGYTDHLGVSPHTGAFDQNMRFHINSSIMLNTLSRWDGYLQREVSIQTVMDASHVMALQGVQIQPNTLAGHSFQQPFDPRTMTPEDLMGNLSMDAITSSGRLPVGSIDLRNHLPPTTTRKSSRNNGIAPNYLARSLNAITSATFSPDAPPGMDNQGIMQAARDQVREQVVANDRFLHHLTTMSSFRDHQSVSWGELCHLFPELHYDPHRVAVSFRGNALLQGPETLGYGQALGGATMENMLVTKLAQAVPAIMMELMLVDVTFTATNQTIDGRYSVLFSEKEGEEPQMFVNVDPVPYVRRFTERLINEVLQDISSNGLIPIGFWMHCEVMGNTFITLQFAGNPPVEYTIPSFCDSLIAPILTFDPSRVDAISTDIAHLAQKHTSY